MAKGVVVSVRVPEELHEQIKTEAERGELTVAQWLIEAAKSKLRGSGDDNIQLGLQRPVVGARGVPFTPAAKAAPEIRGYDALTGEPIVTERKPYQKQGKTK